MRYYIYVYYQQGNIGSNQVEILEGQPKNGFEFERDAELHLSLLIENRKGYYFDRNGYKFTILKTWSSKSALNKK